MKQRTNQMIAQKQPFGAWSQMFENLNCKLCMCWNICHVEFFGGSVDEEIYRNLRLLLTKRCLASVWDCSYIKSGIRNKAQTMSNKNLALSKRCKLVLRRKGIYHMADSF